MALRFDVAPEASIIHPLLSHMEPLF